MREKKRKGTPEFQIHGQPNCVLPKSFFEGRNIPDFHPESLDYAQWWDEQYDRCISGYRDGGFYATPEYYYHLNFKKINMLDREGNIKIFHPYFSEEDMFLFQEIEQARKDGQGFILGTGRGYGKSFGIASIVEHGFTFKEGHETIISSSIEKYANDFLFKVEIGLNSQPDYLRLGLLEDTKLKKVSGYKIKVNGQEKKEGLFSSIKKIVYDSDPDKTRGTRPNIHVFEEGGSWSGAAGLRACYKKTEPSWWRGARFTCLPIIIGTGGAMDTGGSEDFKEMFNHPKSYNLKAFEFEGEKIGKFIPAYKKFGDYYEDSGISDEVGAKGFLDRRRETKSGDPELFRQETMEFPFNPREMFQVAGTGWMPAAALENRYALIERTPELKQMVQKGDLEWIQSGSRMTGVKWVPNPNGIFEVVEHPVWTRKSWGEQPHPKGLYIGGCDSFDAVEEENAKNTNKSPGTLYIYKRFWKVSETSRFFVARLKQRTDDAKEFYWNTIKLALYYSGQYPCKVLGEYTKIGIFRHYIENQFEYLLYERPKLDTVDTGIKKTTATNRYGIHMPGPIKNYVIKRYADWLKEPGVMEQMYFLPLIKDNLEFSFEGYDKNKHDDTMGASIAVLADGDMYRMVVKQAETEAINWPVWRTNAQGVRVFN